MQTTIYESEHIRLESATSLIDAISHPLDPDAEHSLRAIVQQESEALAAACREHESSQLHEALAARDLARAQRDSGRARVAEAEACCREAEQRGATASWTRVAISSFCAAACFCAEFVLTWHALTFLLNVPKYSVLGVLLGLAPPSALGVLELVLLRLLENPWHSVRAAVGVSLWRRAAAATAMFVFLAGLAWGNVYTILLLAGAREEAARAQHTLLRNDGEPPPVVNRDAITRAVLAVSVCVSIDGAVFLLLALQEGRQAFAVRGARHALGLARRRQDSLDEACARAEAAAAVRSEAAREYQAVAVAVAERFRQQCRFRTAQKIAAVKLARSTGQTVEEALRLGLRRGDAPAADAAGFVV